ncbi:hypothetical protein SEA_EASLEY_57 [Gordonia phage Easley]|uniref:Uncharacterized protein n=1 Tax=Gordonia phage Easley TaxID=2182395 RepID=A0A2U8UNN5_9CAUD|nr:hypothetical protein PP510_gp57 [Gordonia phage Easley]AWN05081.1 hypothetical protein SEA_EASLEY_57 [Gordonia phage Easley]
MTGQPVPIISATGDLPNQPLRFTDGYGRSQTLVPIERLQAAEGRIAELEAIVQNVQAFVGHPGNWGTFDGRRAWLLHLLRGGDL